jgi:hypothetical protein
MVIILNVPSNLCEIFVFVKYVLSSTPYHIPLKYKCEDYCCVGDKHAYFMIACCGHFLLQIASWWFNNELKNSSFSQHLNTRMNGVKIFVIGVQVLLGSLMKVQGGPF